MTTQFPSDLDNLTNPTGTDKVSVVDHASQHSNANDAIEALEAKVGKDGSGVITSHDYKLSDVTTTDKAVGVSATQTITNKTLTTPVLDRPRVNSIDDTNGNEAVKVNATASAVNEVGITNATTGNDPLIQPTGDDTNVGIKIKGKGTGKVKVGDAELQLPDVDGTSGQLLTTNGSGVLSWVGATTVADASETVKGIVEEATDAEVSAGTATGGTGAKLFITPAKLAIYNAGSEASKRITSNITTAVNTIADASGLSFSIPANQVFSFEMYLFMTTASNGTKFAINGPAGASIIASCYGANTSLNSFAAKPIAALDTLTADPIASGSGLEVIVVISGTMVNAGTAGTLQLRWASNVDGQTSTIKANSYIKYRKMA